MSLRSSSTSRGSNATGVEHRHDEGCRPAVVLVAFLVCFAFHTSAGAGQTVGAMTGAIHGRVIDSTGAVLPGLTVAISGAALMGDANDSHER
jgi:hypothetical protein